MVWEYGIIEGVKQEGKSFIVDRFLEKPKATETKSRNGVVWKYVLNADIFQYLEKAASSKMTGEIRLADAFELMRQDKDIYWVEIEWNRYDTGSKIGFLQATLAYGLKNDEVKDELKAFIKTLDI
jgi:UTP--glucose-1-phosphate uridylyltransferase